MRIALVEMYPGDKMATGERGRALFRFLSERGHDVQVVAPAEKRLADFYRFRFSTWSRAKRRALRREILPHLWDYVADELAPRLDEGKFDIVVARLQPVAYALTRLKSPCLKIFDAANIAFLESYHGWNADMSEIEVEYRKEIEICRAADYIFLHHDILAQFFRAHVFDSDKVVTVRMGCYPAKRVASHSSSPRIVYAGSYRYIQDPYLLSLLARVSPYPIDCYGKKDPNFSFLPAPLSYRGYREDAAFMAEYQCGLITISQDRLRRHSPSTKFAYYFAHGLPVLFPDWMKEGYTYPAAIPFNEDNFADQARAVCESPGEWRRLSGAAVKTAEGFVWDRVLAPFDDIINRWAAERRSATCGRPEHGTPELPAQPLAAGVAPAPTPLLRDKSVGYVHFGGDMGDLVRVEAIRRFFEQRHIPFVEFVLEHVRPPVNMVRELFSAAAVGQMAQKFRRPRSMELLKEMQWRIEARQWEETVSRASEHMADRVGEISIFHAETLVAGMVCLRLKDRHRLPFVYDMHGVLREEARLTGSREWVEWCSRWERRVIEAAEQVLVVSPLMARYVAKQYRIPHDRIVLAPNGTYATERRATYARPMTVVYAGNFAAFENIIAFLKTAEATAGEYRFWLLGDGPIRNEVFDYINTRFVDIEYWGRKRRDVALDYCARAQVGFSGQTGAEDLERDFPIQIGCPIKLFDYAACGLPLVLPPGEWAATFEDADACVLAASPDARGFSAALEQLADRDVWERKARNAKELVRSKFEWNTVLAPLARLYGKRPS
jgi:glycosyltransferase involved in cell wall biosynthesis